jgi:hypothetical protein
VEHAAAARTVGGDGGQDRSASAPRLSRAQIQLVQVGTPFLFAQRARGARAANGSKFSKALHVVTLYTKGIRALTCENLCQGFVPERLLECVRNVYLETDFSGLHGVSVVERDPLSIPLDLIILRYGGVLCSMFCVCVYVCARERVSLSLYVCTYVCMYVCIRIIYIL